MQKFNVTVTGITPYMQDRMDDQKLEAWEESRGRIIERENLNTPIEKEAFFHSHTTDDGEFFIPCEHFKQCFLNGGKAVKGKMGTATRSMKQVVAGMWFVRPFQIPFRKYDRIDRRSIVNSNNKARVMKTRPIWDTWEVSFILEVHNDTLTLATIKSIIDYGGAFVGIGSYRPQHSGEFGRFTAEVTKVEERVIEGLIESAMVF